MFSEKVTEPWNIEAYGLLGSKKYFEKFVKPFAHPTPFPPATYLMYSP